MDKNLIGQVFEENYEWFKSFLRVRFISLNDYDIEDIIQQAAMKLLYKGENLVGINNLTSYIFTSIQNGAKDHFKKRKNETLTNQDVERVQEGIEEKVLLNELKRVIWKAIEMLDTKQRYVFVETEIKARSYQDLTKETGEKLGTLLSRKSRAVKKLRNIIREYINEEIENER